MFCSVDISQRRHTIDFKLQQNSTSHSRTQTNCSDLWLVDKAITPTTKIISLMCARSKDIVLFNNYFENAKLRVAKWRN